MIKKLGIGCGGLVFVLLVIGIIGSALNPKTPSQTSSANPTATSVVKAEIVPTSPPAPPTATVAPGKPMASAEAHAYLLTLSERIGSAGKALGDLGERSTAAGEDPSLLVDQSWRVQTAASLALMNVTAKAIRESGPVPSEVQDLHPMMLELADDLDYVATEYAAGIDNMDSQRLVNATARTQSVNDLMSRATDEINRLKVVYDW